MNCPSCNAQVPPEATACPGCGAPVAPAAAEAAPAAAPQDAQKKPGFDIKAACSSNPVIKKYGLFIAAGVVVLLVLIICIACASGGNNADMELVIGSFYSAEARELSAGSDKEMDRLQKKGFEYLKKSAEHGNIDAMYLVAEYYLNKEEDETKALKWAEKAEKKGSKAGKELAKKLRKEKKEDAD